MNIRRVAKRLSLLALLMGILAVATPVQAQEVPPKIQVALFMKLLGYYTNLGANDFTIHVVGNDAVADAFKDVVGQKVGKAKIAGVTTGDMFIDRAAKVVYVGKNLEQAINYTRSNEVLSITGVPNFADDGVTLSILLEDKKPKVLLNLASTKAERVNWNPAILRVAEQVN